MKYNTNDLFRARYLYKYTINDSVEVAGERDGVLYFNNGVYVDLITEKVVNKELIIKMQAFNAKDNEIDLNSVKKIFASLEDYYENMAIERQINNISNEIPTIITFKASEVNYALKTMFKKKKKNRTKKLFKFKK